jgi:hypothetical protein
MSITLTNRNWSRDIDTTNPFYEEFIETILAANGELPPSVEVPDVVVEQWDSWLILQDWMKIGPEIFYRTSPHPSERNSANLRRRVPPVVYLADVLHIILTLLTLPPEWVRYAAVDARSSHSERMKHYEAVGRVLLQDTNTEQKLSHFATFAHLFYDFDFPVIGDEWRLLVYSGIRHNAFLMMIGNRDEGYNNREISLTEFPREVNWSYVIWDDVLSIGNGWGVDEVPLPSAAYLLAGKVPPDGVYGEVVSSVELGSHIAAYSFQDGAGGVFFDLNSEIGSPISIKIPAVNKLYDTLLEAMKDLTFVELGLSPVLTRGHYLDINAALGRSVIIPDDRVLVSTPAIIPVIHLNLLLQLPRMHDKWENNHKDLTLDKKYFAKTIQLIALSLGTKALYVMTNSLMNYAEVHDDKKALVFCEQALTYLEEHGTESLFVAFPTYKMISEL